MALRSVGSFFFPSSSSSSTTTTTPSTNSNEILDPIVKQETIERLCDRLQSAIRIDDRRDALRALKAVSKKWKLEVATQTMTHLAKILQGDRTELDLTQLALEILINLMTFEENNNEEQPNLPQDITVQFTELFIKNKEHVHVALDLIEETDFNFRRTAIRFLTVLLKNCTKLLQERILESGPMGVAKLVDLLHDEREVIRNDALLLLQTLTHSNGNIQKIVAFENGFERLFEILASEDGCHGGVIVEDCLTVLLNLLKNNPSNQSFFRESSYIRRLLDFFDLNSLGEQRWSPQKRTNVQFFLQVIRTLVAPTNANQNLLSCQRTVSQCGLLHRLCVMLTLSSLPADILAETINTIAEVIRGHNENQQFFGSVMNTSSDTQQPVLISLLYMMVTGEKQLFLLRIAILYCFECYVYKNDYGKSQIIQTLLPQTENAANQYTLGHLLIVGFLSKDIVASWCSSVAFAHLISDHQQFKEALLQVVLAVSEGQTASKSLMEISLDTLENTSSSSQTRIAVLIFICTWLSNCPLAVQTFLGIPNSVAYLISQICAPSMADDREMLIQSLCSFAFGLCLVFNNNQISAYSNESLERIINKRIGMDLFQDKLESLSKSDYYAKTLQKPQLQISKVNEMLLDYEFVRLYKILEGSITRALTTRTKDEQNKTPDTSTALLTQYYDWIQQQNQQIHLYQEQEKQFHQERQSYQKKISELEQSMSSNGQLKQQDDHLRQLCEQQQAELEYLRNMLAYQQQQQLQVNNHHPSQLDESIQTDPQLEPSENASSFDQRFGAQNDEIARLQLETSILQEKLNHEKRKVAVLQSLESQLQEVIDEKTHLNDEYQRLSASSQRHIQEQNELLALCSTYEDQLRQCRQFIQTTGLTVPQFLLELDQTE